MPSSPPKLRFAPELESESGQAELLAGGDTEAREGAAASKANGSSRLTFKKGAFSKHSRRSKFSRLKESVHESVALTQELKDNVGEINKNVNLLFFTSGNDISDFVDVSVQLQQKLDAIDARKKAKYVEQIWGSEGNESSEAKQVNQQGDVQAEASPPTPRRMALKGQKIACEEEEQQEWVIKAQPRPPIYVDPPEPLDTDDSATRKLKASSRHDTAGSEASFASRTSTPDFSRNASPFENIEEEEVAPASGSSYSSSSSSLSAQEDAQGELDEVEWELKAQDYLDYDLLAGTQTVREEIDQLEKSQRHAILDELGSYYRERMDKMADESKYLDEKEADVNQQDDIIDQSCEALNKESHDHELDMYRTLQQYFDTICGAMKRCKRKLHTKREGDESNLRKDRHFENVKNCLLNTDPRMFELDEELTLQSGVVQPSDVLEVVRMMQDENRETKNKLVIEENKMQAYAHALERLQDRSSDGELDQATIQVIREIRESQHGNVRASTHRRKSSLHRELSDRETAFAEAKRLQDECDTMGRQIKELDEAYLNLIEGRPYEVKEFMFPCAFAREREAEEKKKRQAREELEKQMQSLRGEEDALSDDLVLLEEKEEKKDAPAQVASVEAPLTFVGRRRMAVKTMPQGTQNPDNTESPTFATRRRGGVNMAALSSRLGDGNFEDAPEIPTSSEEPQTPRAPQAPQTPRLPQSRAAEKRMSERRMSVGASKALVGQRHSLAIHSLVATSAKPPSRNVTLCEVPVARLWDNAYMFDKEASDAYVQRFRELQAEDHWIEANIKDFQELEKLCETVVEGLKECQQTYENTLTAASKNLQMGVLQKGDDGDLMLHKQLEQVNNEIKRKHDEQHEENMKQIEQKRTQVGAQLEKAESQLGQAREELEADKQERIRLRREREELKAKLKEVTVEYARLPTIKLDGERDKLKFVERVNSGLEVQVAAAERRMNDARDRWEKDVNCYDMFYKASMKALGYKTKRVAVIQAKNPSLDEEDKSSQKSRKTFSKKGTFRKALSRAMTNTVSGSSIRSESKKSSGRSRTKESTGKTRFRNATTFKKAAQATMFLNRITPGKRTRFADDDAANAKDGDAPASGSEVARNVVIERPTGDSDRESHLTSTDKMIEDDSGDASSPKVKSNASHKAMLLHQTSRGTLAQRKKVSVDAGQVDADESVAAEESDAGEHVESLASDSDDQEEDDKDEHAAPLTPAFTFDHLDIDEEERERRHELEMHIARLEDQLMKVRGLGSVDDIDDLIYANDDCPPSLLRVRKDLSVAEETLSQANPLWQQARVLAETGERTQENRDKIVELCSAAMEALETKGFQSQTTAHLSQGYGTFELPDDAEIDDGDQ